MPVKKVRKLISREELVRSCKPSELPFSKDEFRSRLRKVKASMKRSCMDMLFLSSPESLFYLSGYRAEWYQAQSPKPWPPSSGIAVHVDSPDFILFDSADEELMARCETCAKDLRVTEKDGLKTWTDWITVELDVEGWLESTVGLEMWSYRPNRAVSEAFQRGLEERGCTVVDGSDIVRDLRAIKSEAELDCIEKASRIADVGLKAAGDAMAPGVTELQVYGALIRAMSEAGGENPGIPLPVISGQRSARGHALASRKKLRKGDIVNVDVCGVYNRYHSNHARTYSIGKPDAEVKAVVDESARAFEVLDEVIEPGLAVELLLGVMRRYYERAGIYRDRMWFGGYELGIAFPPDWVGPFVYDETLDCEGIRFMPGNVVNYESNFYLPKKAGGSLLINTIEFRKKEAKILGKTQNELIVI